MALGMSPGRRMTNTRSNRSDTMKSLRGSMIEGAPMAPETDEQKAEREKREFQESFKIMSKDESKDEMKKKGFEDFLSKTSRIIERALDQEFDVVGDFFGDDEDDEAAGLKNKKRDKIT